MTGVLTHSPARVISQLMVDLGVASGVGTGTWPVFPNTLLDSPDNAIRVKDTVGIDRGRFMGTGERQENEGFQVMVRAGKQATGWTRANLIATTFDTGVRADSVTVESTTYLIDGISRSGVMSLGAEKADSKRELLTFNGTITFIQV